MLWRRESPFGPAFRPARGCPGRGPQRALYQQLGLVHDDFFTSANEFGIPVAESRGDDFYPLQPPDALPMPRQNATAERYHSLGGGSVINQVSHDRTTSPTFVLTLTQVSQRWCRRALANTANPALFPPGTPRTALPADVKATLRRWSLRFLGERFSDAQVDAHVQALRRAGQSSPPGMTPRPEVHKS